MFPKQTIALSLKCHSSQGCNLWQNIWEFSSFLTSKHAAGLYKWCLEKLLARFQWWFWNVTPWGWHEYTCGTDTDTQSKQIYRRLGKASHLYDTVVIPVKKPQPSHTHMPSYTQTHTHSPLCSHPYCPSINIPSLWQGCQHAPPQVGEGRKMRGTEEEVLLWEKDIRACKFAQWLKREDKEKNEEKWVGGWWNRCIKKHERMARGLQERHLALVFFPKEQERRHQAGDTSHSWKFYTFCAFDIITFF